MVNEVINAVRSLTKWSRSMELILQTCALKYEEKVMDIKFYFCKHCGKIITMVNNANTPTICCGEEMQELEPGVTDGIYEKHVPEVSVNKGKVTVQVGKIMHPMSEDHYIQWILLQTDKGIYMKELTYEDKPKVDFFISKNESIIGVYSYCNLHKLWKNS